MNNPNLPEGYNSPYRSQFENLGFSPEWAMELAAIIERDEDDPERERTADERALMDEAHRRLFPENE